MKNTFIHLVYAFLMLIFSFSFAQSDEEETGLKSVLNGFSFRSVGPAFMSGRIADILPGRTAICTAINPMTDPDMTTTNVLSSPKPNNRRVARVKGDAAC